MKVIDNIYPVDSLIGKTVLSKSTGNKLGSIYDLLVDPIKGILMGFAIQIANKGEQNSPETNLVTEMEILPYPDVYSFGPDAVMANQDDSIVPFEALPYAGIPGIKKHIAKAQIVTEGGKLLGQVANIFVHLAAPPIVIYEVRESLLDKLLGRGLFIPAFTGRALSDDAQRIIVPDDLVDRSAESLEALAYLITPLVEEETKVHARVELTKETESRDIQ